jgi:hypothetical protein
LTGLVTNLGYQLRADSRRGSRRHALPRIFDSHRNQVPDPFHLYRAGREVSAVLDPSCGGGQLKAGQEWLDTRGGTDDRVVSSVFRGPLTGAKTPAFGPVGNLKHAPSAQSNRPRKTMVCPTSGTTGAHIPPETSATRCNCGRPRSGKRCVSLDISSAAPTGSWNGRTANPAARSRSTGS